MFRAASRRNKNSQPEPVFEVTIDTHTYERLKELACTHGVSEDEELLGALRRGMEDYWLHVVRCERQRYQSLQKIFAQAKRDSELLEALLQQNIRFRQVLDERLKQPEDRRQR